MSWKPSRSSGIMFDQFNRKAETARRKLDELIPNCNPPAFKDINRLSKLYYLYWLNDNKKSKVLTGSNSLSRPFEQYCTYYYINIFKKYPEYTYKPLQKIIN
jgi:hypothetical protein